MSEEDQNKAWVIGLSLWIVGFITLFCYVAFLP
jgi:hypothetical protein